MRTNEGHLPLQAAVSEEEKRREQLKSDLSRLFPDVPSALISDDVILRLWGQGFRSLPALRIASWESLAELKVPTRLKLEIRWWQGRRAHFRLLFLLQFQRFLQCLDSALQAVSRRSLNYRIG